MSRCCHCQIPLVLLRLVRVVLFFHRVRASHSQNQNQTHNQSQSQSQSQCVSENENENENGNGNRTDSGGDACSYYARHPHHCGCCDTAAFNASDCCACQQTLAAGNASWWTSVFQTWPRKARVLRLSGKGIQGQIPGDIAQRWPLLTQIDLSRNELTGSLPPGLGGLGGLPFLSHLRLNDNQLSGPLPPQLGNLKSLQALYLQDNQLSGSLPPELGNMTSLETVDLNRNQFSGRLPPELSSLSKLQVFMVYTNRLSGSIPPEFGNLTSLQLLDLGGNRFKGPLPGELGSLTRLHTLYFDSNQLSGSLPPELGNLVGLQRLYLSDNQFSGPLPPELGKLTLLQYLQSDSNMHSGPLPPELGNLTSLQILRLGGNRFSGSLPPELGSLMSLQHLSLQDNRFSGSLPQELGSLMSLQELVLSGNQLTGGLPPELGKLASLELLSLNGNQLNGSLPPEIGSLVSLETLSLQGNELSGSLPAELGSLQGLQILNLESNQLSGGLPASFSGLRSLEELRVSGNPLFCGGAEVVVALQSIRRLELVGCCFQDFAGLPASLEFLDLTDNLLTEVPRPWREQSLSLKTLGLSGNRISHWDTSAIVPLSLFTGAAWLCGYRPTGQRFPWQQLENLDVSRNPLSTPIFDFLASLSHLAQLSVLQARGAGLQGPLPHLSADFVPYLLHTGEIDCTGLPGVQPGFPALRTLDLSQNNLTALLASPSPQLTQADLHKNQLTALNSQWWKGGQTGALQRVDARSNPSLQLPVLLNASSTCPELGATDLTANSQGWNGQPDGRVECTTLCPMSHTRILLDATANESVLCRCTQGQGVGQDCSPCPADTYSTMSFGSGQYSRACQACPTNSKLRGKQGLCFAECSCSAGYHMAQISNGTAQDVGTTPCSRLAPEGRCLSCGIFKTSFQGGLKASDCFCNSNQSNGGWEGLLERQGRCGCPEGFHMNFAERSCVPCQPQEDCSDWTRSLEPPAVKPGFWAAPPPPEGSDGLFGNFSGHSIWRCQSTTACPGNAACGWDRTGTACSLCRQGYFRTPSGSCARCLREHTETRLLLTAFLLACVVFPILAHLELRANMGEPRGLALAFRSVLTSLKQMLRFAQILGLISLFGVEWPPVADSVFTVTRAFSLDFGTWLGVACLDDQQQESMSLVVGVRWMMPLAGVAVTCLAALLVTILGRVLGRLSARCCRQREERIRQLLQFRPLDVLRVLVFFLHLFFPSLLKNALLPLTCAPSPNGVLTMNSWPHRVCWNRGFWAVASLAITQSALLSLGFPALLLFAWKRIEASRTMDVLKQRRRWWAFVFVDFRSQKTSWVLVTTCKDILLNLVVVALPGMGTAQLLITAVVSIVYGCSAFCTSPYPDVSNTLLETCAASAVAALCLFTAGVGFQSEPDMPSLEASIIGGRDSVGYAQRAISLVCLQGFSLVCPAAIIAFQVLVACPRSRHWLPARLQPMSREEREEWSNCFARAMRLEGGPLPRVLAELDSVDFSNFRQAAITGQLTQRGLSLTLGTSPRRSHDEAEEESEPESESAPALHKKIAQLHTSNAALSSENAALSMEIAGLQAQNAALSSENSRLQAALDPEGEQPVQPQLLGRESL